MVLKMSKDKTLVITKSGTTYKNEHNAEAIKIIMPKQIEGKDLKQCSIWLSFMNEEKLGKAIDVSEFLTDYSPTYYYIEIPMDNIFTYVAGKVRITLVFNKPLYEIFPLLLQGVHHRSFHNHPLIYGRVIGVLYWFLTCFRVQLKIMFLILQKRSVVDN